MGIIVPKVRHHLPAYHLRLAGCISRRFLTCMTGRSSAGPSAPVWRPFIRLFPPPGQGDKRRNGYHDDFIERVQFIALYPGGPYHRKTGHKGHQRRLFFLLHGSPGKPCQVYRPLYFFYMRRPCPLPRYPFAAFSLMLYRACRQSRRARWARTANLPFSPQAMD
jgi:hypothetical protein